MKKLIVLIVVFILAVGFTACGGDSSSTPTKSDPDSNLGGSSSSESSQSNNTDKVVYTLENETIYNDQDVAFTITSINENGFWGFTVKVLCENDTSSTLMFSWDSVSVNGFMIDPFWATEVAAGKKSNSDISFSSSQLERANVHAVEEIELTLKIYDSDDWSADNLVNEVFTIYPTGLNAGSITYPEKEKVTGEQVFVDDENCLFIIEGEGDDSIWGYTLYSFLENKTDQTLMFTMENVSVNGFMSDPFWATSIAPGKRSFCDISFSSTNFEENGINEVNDIEFTLRIYDYDDWSASDFVNEVFTYIP